MLLFLKVNFHLEPSDYLELRFVREKRMKIQLESDGKNIVLRIFIKMLREALHIDPA